MNTDRLYYGDINKIEYETKRVDYELFEGEEVMATIPLEERYISIKPYKRKVILVKFDNYNYVELAKLKTLKDFIKARLEIFFESKKTKYILTEDFIRNDLYIVPFSLHKYEGNLKENESVKKLHKILLEEKNNR